MSHIYLIGFLDSGNVTIGKALAEKLSRPFCDSGAALAEALQTDLVSFYQESGPEAYAERQEEVFSALTQREQAQVIAVTDHAPLSDGLWEKISQTGTTIYIQRTPERLYWRLRHDPKQPPLRDVANQARLERIEAMLAEREGTYLRSTLTIPCDHEQVPEIVESLLQRLDRRHIAGARAPVGED